MSLTCFLVGVARGQERWYNGIHVVGTQEGRARPRASTPDTGEVPSGPVVAPGPAQQNLTGHYTWHSSRPHHCEL